MLKTLVALVALVTLTVSTTSTRQQPPPDLIPEEKLYGLSLFWKEASEHFVFFDRVPDLDWDKAYREYIPRVLASKSKAEYYKELRKFSALLRDGHSFVQPPADGWEKIAYPPVAVTALNGRAYITNVMKPYGKDFPAGSEIVKVEGIPTLEYANAKIDPFTTANSPHVRMKMNLWLVLQGIDGETRKFTIKTHEGEVRDVEAKCANYPNPEWEIKPASMGLAPGTVQYKELGDGIAYVRINNFWDGKAADEFEALIPKLKDAKGMVIDLRNNGGGDDSLGVKIVQNFTRDKFQSYAWKTREQRSAFHAWGSFIKPDQPDLSDFQKKALAYYKDDVWYSEPAPTYKGKPDAQLLMPKVVLMNWRTASASESMLLNMDKIENIWTVGEPTNGSNGQPYIFSLPGGGDGRICTHRLTYPDGREFIGIGILPDVPIEATIEDVLAQRDAVLNKGLEVLKSKIRTAL